MLKRKIKLLINSSIGIVLGMYIVFIMLDEKGILEGSNKGVLFTVSSSLVCLVLLRILISKTSSD